jgi:hypothetical protein
MGPIILLDKSSIQSLSAQEIEFLYRYYTINIAPVLIIEILGDLMKPNKEDVLTGKDVQELSNKLLQIDSAVSVHYRTLIAHSLLGNEVSMDGRPYVPGGRSVEEPGGKKGVVFDEDPEEKAIHRWRSGQFSEAEALLSHRWRESTVQIDLGRTKEMYKPIASLVPETASFEQLVSAIDKILVEPELQTKLLRQLIYEFSFDPQFASRVFHRWEQRQFSRVKDFAPYAFFCFSATFSFYIGLVRNFIGTRPTNRVDLEYAYYAPFAMVFSSRDNFHKTFVPPFLRPDQTFVSGDQLKQDLKNIADVWNSLAPERRTDWLKENGQYPPERDNSITLQLWQKYMQPRRRIVREESQSDQPKRAAQEIMEIVKKLQPDGEIQDVRTQLADDRSGIDFLVQKRTISTEDPCPCGSGKKLKDCHLEQFKGSGSAPVVNGS